MKEKNKQKNENSWPKLKPEQPKQELKSDTNESSTDSTFGNLKPPKLKNNVSNANLSEKLDKLIANSPTENTLNQLPSKSDLENVKNSVSAQSSKMQNHLEAKMRAQTSKLLNSATDTRDIVYNEGLKDNLKGANQRIDALQKRMDNSTRSMSDIAKQNDAMNADFKQIGETLNQSTQAINNNTNCLKRVLTNGFNIHTTDVTKSVAQEFEEVIGKPLSTFLSEKLLQELRFKLKTSVSQANQAQADTQVLANEVREVTQQNVMTIKTLQRSINIWLVEFAIILGATMATPGLWKYLMLIATSLGVIVFNNYLEKGSE